MNVLYLRVLKHEEINTYAQVRGERDSMFALAGKSLVLMKEILRNGSEGGKGLCIGQQCIWRVGDQAIDQQRE